MIGCTKEKKKEFKKRMQEVQRSIYLFACLGETSLAIDHDIIDCVFSTLRFCMEKQHGVTKAAYSEHARGIEAMHLEEHLAPAKLHKC